MNCKGLVVIARLLIRINSLLKLEDSRPRLIPRLHFSRNDTLSILSRRQWRARVVVEEVGGKERVGEKEAVGGGKGFGEGREVVAHMAGISRVSYRSITRKSARWSVSEIRAKRIVHLELY